jgi:hypothetical protein
MPRAKAQLRGKDPKDKEEHPASLARKIYEEKGRNAPEAMVDEALKHENLLFWLLKKGATLAMMELRSQSRHQSLMAVETTPTYNRNTPVPATIDIEPIRKAAQERGKEAAKAISRTSRLSSVWSYPMFDQTELGDATVEKLQKQADWHERMADGNQKAYEAFTLLAKKVKQSGQPRLRDALSAEEVSKIMTQKRLK